MTSTGCWHRIQGVGGAQLGFCDPACALQYRATYPRQVVLEVADPGGPAFPTGPAREALQQAAWEARCESRSAFTPADVIACIEHWLAEWGGP